MQLAGIDRRCWAASTTVELERDVALLGVAAARARRPGGRSRRRRARTRWSSGGRANARNSLSIVGQPLDLVMRELDRLDELRIVALAAQPALEQLELELRGVERVADLVGEPGAHRLQRGDPVGLDRALARDQPLLGIELVVAQHQRELDVEQLVDRAHDVRAPRRRDTARAIRSRYAARTTFIAVNMYCCAEPDLDVTRPIRDALLVERASYGPSRPVDIQSISVRAQPLDLLGSRTAMRGRARVRPHRLVEPVGDRGKRRREHAGAARASRARSLSSSSTYASSSSRITAWLSTPRPCARHRRPSAAPRCTGAGGTGSCAR